MVAREIGYDMPGGWGQGDAATQDAFRPIETFEDRFDALLEEVAALGFDAIDLWTAHLHYAWATPEHIAIARRLLETRKIRIVSYAGGFGESIAEFRGACRLCNALDIPVLGGSTPLLTSHRSEVVEALRASGMLLAYENHPEKSVDEILAKLGEGDEDVIGVTLDTGWLATNGVDVAAALRALAPRLMHLHLKDVKAPGAEKTGYPMVDMGHATCQLGEGVVPVEECVMLLPEIGYEGVISIEHEPEDYDPHDEISAGAVAVRGWQAGYPPTEATLTTQAPCRIRPSPM